MIVNEYKRFVSWSKMSEQNDSLFMVKHATNHPSYLCILLVNMVLTQLVVER